MKVSNEVGTFLGLLRTRTGLYADAKATTVINSYDQMVVAEGQLPQAERASSGVKSKYEIAARGIEVKNAQDRLEKARRKVAIAEEGFSSALLKHYGIAPDAADWSIPDVSGDPAVGIDRVREVARKVRER